MSGAAAAGSTTNDVENVIVSRQQEFSFNVEPVKADLTDQIEDIGLTLRALMTRIRELEAEVVRLHQAAEQARAVSAHEIARRVVIEHEFRCLRPYEQKVKLLPTYEASSDELRTTDVDPQKALDELYATKLLRWSARPRRWYAAIRNMPGRKR